MSYQDLLIDLSEVYGIMLFMFILISSANTTNILMLDLNKTQLNKHNLDSNTISNSTNLNYKSLNYVILKYTKTSSTLFSLCNIKQNNNL